MNYIEVDLRIEPRIPFADILTSELAEIGFESFVDTDSGVAAYIPESDFDPDAVKATCNRYPDAQISFAVKQIEQKNWNETWEADYAPITVEDLCQIRAPFHTPDNNVELQVIIAPKMAFGTGHHETTWQMVKALFGIPLSGKRVLDFGCGSGILSIVAEKRGAKSVFAFDVDEWSVENTRENIGLNECSKIQVAHGDSGIIPAKTSYEVVLANINKNVIMADLPRIANATAPNGLVLLSGFFQTDSGALIAEAEKYQLQFVVENSKNHWAQLIFQKKP